MANSYGVIDGLQILRKYAEKNEDSYFITAEHDTIHVNVPFEEPNDDDRKLLATYGWFLSEHGSWAVYT